ncbi:DUF2264 domain-containing protein [Streptomyces violaceusniger]|uniref:DUF2264 domain-containing protein n=1 Tax=Streptomyces violaceusniger TaxID=68280 RepID=UPI0031D5E60D
MTGLAPRPTPRLTPGLAPHFALPPEDRDLSPRTGWTRAHWEAAADGLLAAVAPYATPGGALYPLPGDRPSWSGPRSDGLEGYARTFLLAALRVAGARGADPGGLLERYADGLATGTARSGTARSGTAHPGGDRPEDWPRITDRGQPLVESASIALGLRLTRPWLWDRLDDGVRERVAAWLLDALTAEPVPSNWELFPVAVGGFLAEAGIEPEAARAAVARGLERIEPWYTGDGWYSDGAGRAFDYYNGWALHLYPALEAWLSQDGERLTRYGRRLATHLVDYAHLFGADGAPLHQGRSLTYRFAAAAPLWLGALTGHTPLDPGTTRRLASGALRHFLDRGATTDRGLLSLGWYGPYDGVLQPYSGPASPYWAAKGFLGLLLPADHEVWTAREEPGPVERADATRAVPGPNWLLQSTAGDGLVRLHNHGSEHLPPPGDPDQDDPHYARFAYSTVTGPFPYGVAPDNHFGLVHGGRISLRTALEPLGAGEGWAASRHRARLVGEEPEEGEEVRVTSLVLVRGAVEVRVHLVTGAAPGRAVRQTGWAVPDPPAEEGPRSELLPLHGLMKDGALPAAPTAFARRAVSPALTGETTGRAGGDLFLCLARLTADPDAPPLAGLVRAAAGPADDGTHLVSVTWWDGEVRRARMGPSAVTVDGLTENAG